VSKRFLEGNMIKVVIAVIIALFLASAISFQLMKLTVQQSRKLRLPVSEAVIGSSINVNSILPLADFSGQGVVAVPIVLGLLVVMVPFIYYTQ
jgi:hypothetical protein